MDNYFSTDIECETFVNGLYYTSFLINLWYAMIAPRMALEVASDDAWMGNTQQADQGFQPLCQYYVTPSNVGYLEYYYKYHYLNIADCNIAVDRVSEAPIDENLAKRLVGEAKFLRAYSYFELVNCFGPVAMPIHSLGTDNMNIPRSSVDEVYAQIEKDLLDAAGSLNEEKSYGRATAWSAKAFLARVYLFRGEWQKAVDYATDVIDNSGALLEPQFVNIWSVDNHNGVESLFEFQSNSAPDKTLGCYFCTFCGARGQSKDDFPSKSNDDVSDGWGWGVPTSDLENCYLSEGDEVRRRSTITKWGEAVYGDEELNPTYKFDLSANKSGRVIRKYYVPIATRRTLVDKANNAPLNVPILRLGEMYLTRAEALWHLGQVDKAMEDVDIIRSRVGLAGKKGKVSGNDALRAIWKERRMELAFEGLRLYDIRREIDPDTNQPVICSIMGPNGSFVKYNTTISTDPYETKNLKELQNKGINFDPSKHLLWPIPQFDIDRSNGTLSQNPGY